MSSRYRQKPDDVSSSEARFVAVTASIRREDDTSRVAVATTYLNALENARLVPVLFPPVYDESTARAALRRVDGLLLTGGGDVDPAIYGQTPKHDLRRVSRARDESEMHLIRAASAMKIPTLAICRGIQILNVAFGGTIVQDLSADWPASLAHDDSSPRNTRSHMVTLEPDSATVRALGAEQIDVNSFHHQAVDKLGDGLRITGRSPDGVVEAVESSDPEWWALCVQWHPEDLVDEPQSPDRGIFRAFADQVSRTDA